MSDRSETNADKSAFPSVTPASVVCWRGEPLAAHVGGRVVLMSASAGNYYDLDEIGSDVWTRLAQPIRVGDLCATLATEYEGDRAVVERDVLALLSDLAAHNLIEVRSAA
jgi:hypothetical protein